MNSASSARRGPLLSRSLSLWSVVSLSLGPVECASIEWRSLEESLGRVNWRRIFLGGLLAGLIVNVFQIFWSGIVLGRQWRSALHTLNRPLPAAAVWIFLLDSFAIGIAAVWLYAVVRTRFDPGPRTAVLAGFAYWIIGYSLPDIGIIQTGVFPAKLLVLTDLGGLGIIILATLVGASFYRE